MIILCMYFSNLEVSWESSQDEIQDNSHQDRTTAVMRIRKMHLLCSKPFKGKVKSFNVIDLHFEQKASKDESMFL